MYYLKDKNEQEQLIRKIREIYSYDYILLEKLELHKLFNYIAFINEDYTIGDTRFFDTLKDICTYANNEHIYVYIADNKYVNATFDAEKIYPSVFITKEELQNSKKVVDFLDKIPGGDSMFICGKNICVMPSSLEWLVVINRYNELGCFVSNNIDIIKFFKEKMNFYADKDIFYLKDELIEEGHICVEKSKFDLLSIGKMENIGGS